MFRDTGNIGMRPLSPLVGPGQGLRSGQLEASFHFATTPEAAPDTGTAGPTNRLLSREGCPIPESQRPTHHPLAHPGLCWLCRQRTDMRRWAAIGRLTA